MEIETTLLTGREQKLIEARVFNCCQSTRNEAIKDLEKSEKRKHVPFDREKRIGFSKT